MAGISQNEESPSMATFQAVSRQRTYLDSFLILAAFWFLLLAIVHAWPVIDVRISEMFFSSPLCVGLSAGDRCGNFPLSKDSSITTLRWILYALPYVAAGMVVVALAVAGFSPRLRRQMPVHRLWMSLVSLGIGTGLITNVFLKGHSGRPRPVQTDLFGGKLEFMPAGSFGGACERNCSFVSGEASGAGWLICLLFLLPPNYRTWIAPPVILASVGTAALRVAVGAHYASDATLGLLLSITVFVGMLAVEERVANP